jgi:hypothetical protein
VTRQTFLVEIHQVSPLASIKRSTVNIPFPSPQLVKDVNDGLLSDPVSVSGSRITATSYADGNSSVSFIPSDQWFAGRQEGKEVGPIYMERGKIAQHPIIRKWVSRRIGTWSGWSRIPPFLLVTRSSTRTDTSLSKGQLYGAVGTVLPVIPI